VLAGAVQELAADAQLQRDTLAALEADNAALRADMAQLRALILATQPRTR
jgi:hypothetical protein